MNDQLRRRSLGAPAARSMLLTTLGDYVPAGEDGVWHETLIAALNTLGYKPRAARQALARSVNAGWLSTERHGRRSRVRLTVESEQMLRTGEMALACDVRYAVAGRYRLGTPEVTLGPLPGNGGTQRLPRLIGVGPALELLTTGRQVGPDEALRLGLVSQVFDDEAAMTAHVQSLTALPPLAIAEIKRAVYLGVQQPLADGLELERELIEGLFRSQDAHEGLTAFSEKRAPDFVGA